MMQPVIEAKSLSKRYSLKGPRVFTLRESLGQWWYKISGGRTDGERQGPEDFWALKDVSFSIRSGECVGIIGKNGAGKSTLLKILSKITLPSSGQAVIRGRVASLIEVGTGFHPELSGRENVYLNGAILGMKKPELSKKFDEIVEFAEIGHFIDMPVKRYSSGMYLRLAFSIAAHLDPEVLLVDEVLAVGDASFQQKSLGKMSSAVREGRTVLFVSHNMEAVSKLTKRCLYIKNGRLQADGPSDRVICEYLSEENRKERVYRDPVLEGTKVIKVEVKTSEEGGVHVQGQPMDVEIEIFSDQPVPQAAVGFQIKKGGMPIGFFWVFDKDLPIARTAGITKLKCRIPKLRLFMGQHDLTIILGKNAGAVHVQELHDICPFEIVMHGHERERPWGEATCRYLEDFSWGYA